MTTPQPTTYIAPDGRLYTYKQFENWSGYRPVEGSEELRLRPGAHTVSANDFAYDSKTGAITPVTFSIQD